ncbi:MAG: hypothetical protein K6E20_07285 [Acholeplasmatales bacterium]|nr:hypothetical protein [Acholeplasmatales bacterium]
MIDKRLKKSSAIDFESVLKEILESQNIVKGYKKTVIQSDSVVTIVVFEKFFLQISSDLSVTIIYTEADYYSEVEIVAAGANVFESYRKAYNGELYNSFVTVDGTHGRDYYIADQISKIFIKYGFTPIN